MMSVTDVAEGELSPTCFLHSITDPLVGLDREWRYTFVNEAAERLKGVPATELLGRSIWEIYPKAMGTNFHRTYKRAMDEGTTQVIEDYYAPFDRWYEVTIYPANDGLWAWFRDITPRKRAEHALRVQEERYRSLFERVPSALYRTAPDGTLLDVNPALMRMLGYSDRQSFMKVNAADVYVDRRDRTEWKRMLETEGQAVFEMRDRCADGRIIWVRDAARAVTGPDGEVMFYEGVLEDITAQREAADALRESEERFRLLADASDDVIWDWDLASGEVRWNEALHSVFGHPPESTGRTIERSWAWWSAHVHPDDRQQTTAAIEHAIESGMSAACCGYRFRRLDGSYADVIDRVYIGRDEGGQPDRIIGAMLDTARHLIEPPPHAQRAEGRPPVPATSDATLVEWLADGDENALHEIYVRHAAMLFASARGLVDTAEEAEEVVADVFVTAWADASRYDRERGSVTSWLLTLCRSRALERTRKRNRRHRILKGADVSDMHGAPAPAVSAAFESRSARAAVQDSLGRLPEPQRNVIELAYFGGLSHTQIAARLDEPLGTVKTRIRDGVGKLRRILVEEPN